MDSVSSRVVPVLILAALATACVSDSVTGPSITSVAGEWYGTFTVASCSVSGDYTACMLSPGITQPAVLLLTQNGATISGKAVYGEINVQAAPDWYHPFTTRLEPDGRLQILTGWGRSPMTVTKLEWDLRVDGSDRLQGTLTATHTWYRIRGAAVSAGVVEATRQ